jgi:DNA-binding NarL/FixJ family response regulator
MISGKDIKRKQVNILLADDHVIVREGLKVALSARNDFVDFVIFEASNTEEALKIFEQVSINVVLMDYEIPKLGGVSATKEIRKINPDVKVLGLSHFNDENIIERMVKAGCCGYLVKTADRGELLKAINNVLNGEYYFSGDAGTKLAVTGKKISVQDLKKGNLTRRELEILKCIVEEMTNEQISNYFSISIRTVETHRQNMMLKLNAKNTVGLLKAAYDQGII